MTTIEHEHAATLHGMAAGDPPGPSAAGMPGADDSGLDARAHALVRLAALVAQGAPPASYARLVAAALRCGATRDDLVGVLVALAPQVGEARVAAAAGCLTRALGAAGVRAGA